MSNKSVTLQTAILTTVTEFSRTGQKFSAHDITQSIRKQCNVGNMEIPEVEALSGADSHRFHIDHVKVRDAFLQMYDTGIFDSGFSISRNHNGRYYEYVFANTSVNTPLVATVPTPQTYQPTTSNVNSSILDRVKLYLSNCQNRNFSPTIKHVQSAIKRGNKSTGIRRNQLIAVISGLGYHNVIL